jgi:hypothetical protein
VHERGKAAGTPAQTRARRRSDALAINRLTDPEVAGWRQRLRQSRRGTCEVSTDRVSFIVRLWQDDDSAESSHPAWRGQVSRVPDGEPSYACVPDELPTLLAREIKRCRIRLGWTWRLRIAVHGWKRNWKKRR